MPFPEEGTREVVCFAYGLPNKPDLQSIPPHGLSLPKVPKVIGCGSAARLASSASMPTAMACTLPPNGI